jgi:hypothetical protein
MERSARLLGTLVLRGVRIDRVIPHEDADLSVGTGGRIGEVRQAVGLHAMGVLHGQSKDVLLFGWRELAIATSTTSLDINDTLLTTPAARGQQGDRRK